MGIDERLGAYFRQRRHVWLRYAQVLIDLGVLTSSFFVAFLIRFDGRIPTAYLQVALASFPYVILATIAALVAFGARRSVWRYVGPRDAVRVLLALSLVAFVLVGIRLWGPEPLIPLKLPLGVISINYFLAFLGLCGVRLARRMQYERSKIRTLRVTAPSHRVLLVGAGDAGRLVAREIYRRPDLGLIVTGFIDDDPSKQKKWIEGAQVLGVLADLERVVTARRVDLVIITFSSVPSQVIRQIVAACTEIPVPVRIIPGVYEIVGDRVSVNQIRDVRIEDLLAREVITFDPSTPELVKAYGGRRVLVTGAGGSIGSEVCRQLSQLQPSSLILLDKDENAVFEIELAMRELMPRERLHPVILDLRREPLLRRVFAEHHPEVVVHAAAHKHVPLLEDHAAEAVDNNVLGTELLVRTSLEFGVSTFVMVSTDKAVNPTNVMGATKRLAEMIVQVGAQNDSVQFSCVRFGNVLESRGSVVPIFKRQIARGGPVTVTDPEITRYFMTIGEAAQLILQAGSLGHRGDIFVLDMGQPVKVIDLARDLIRLSVPGRSSEIPIEIVGLRPGEKLREELLIAEEGVRATRFRKIMIAPQRPIDARVLHDGLERLRHAVIAQDDAAIIELLNRLDTGYQPWRRTPTAVAGA